MSSFPLKFLSFYFIVTLLYIAELSSTQQESFTSKNLAFKIHDLRTFIEGQTKAGCRAVVSSGIKVSRWVIFSSIVAPLPRI
jgi:hypothetical protein